MKITAGQICGKLTVTSHAGYGAKGHPRWLCRCECGGEKVAFETALSQGRTKSCGCLQSAGSMKKLMAEVGRKYGMLTVLGFSHRTDDNRCMFDCICDCGIAVTTNIYTMRQGKARSCGCQCDQTRHGMVYTPEHKSWSGMIHRCNNKSHKNYDRYGGRGIAVCERWLGPSGFENFYADMGPKPTRLHSIDRINNDGNYEPGNCRWATMREQQGNKRNNIMLTIGGETMNVADWARKLNLPPKRIYQWVSKGVNYQEKMEKILQSLDF